MKAQIMLAAIALFGVSAGLVTAGTVDQFNFTQTGFSGGGVLGGSFTATLEADGTIQQADVSAFNATFTTSNSGVASSFYYYLSTLSFFSLIPSSSDGPNSTFDLKADNGFASICSGAAAAFDLCGTANGAVGFFSFDFSPSSEATTQFASLTLVSQLSSNPAPPGSGTPSNAAPSAAPEPASLGLLGVSMVACGVAYARRTWAQRKVRIRRRETIYISRA
jgi:hypothetical protein